MRVSLCVVLVALQRSSAISVEGLASHAGNKELAEYWVENHQIFTNAFNGEDGASTTNVRLKGFNCALEQCCVVCRKPPRGYDLRRRCLAMDAAGHAPRSPHAL